MKTGSQIIPGKLEPDGQASSTFSLRDTFSKNIAACPEGTHLALARSHSGTGRKALGKFRVFSAGSLALFCLSIWAETPVKLHQHHNFKCTPHSSQFLYGPDPLLRTGSHGHTRTHPAGQTAKPPKWGGLNHTQAQNLKQL